MDEPKNVGDCGLIIRNPDGTFGEGSINKRGPGKVSKEIKTVTEWILSTFNSIQGHPTANLKSWAEENPTEFYRIASKMITQQVVTTIKRAGLDAEIQYIEESNADKTE